MLVRACGRSLLIASAFQEKEEAGSLAKSEQREEVAEVWGESRRYGMVVLRDGRTGKLRWGGWTALGAT